ncbi:Alpha-D-phosphohexomutase alpha/beta/alpha domain I [Trinorchestia longiramus]|nr:Alpha-D-phosphohexomutase alpha/beta/alpha domain I [Trinorchestia longiramus]
MEDLPQNLRVKVEEWMKWDQNDATRKEIEELVDNKKHQQLADLMLSRVVFGTAGLRSRMGAGYSQLNDLVILQTSQGLVKYLLEVEPSAAERGIVIGYDSRHNSHRCVVVTVSGVARSPSAVVLAHRQRCCSLTVSGGARSPSAVVLAHRQRWCSLTVSGGARSPSAVVLAHRQRWCSLTVSGGARSPSAVLLAHRQRWCSLTVSGVARSSFARLAASAFLVGGVRVYLLGDICPTPFVPFTVKELHAAAGVMVTASHNPKEDNGYKVYWTNSAQIITPHDCGIQEKIEEQLEPWGGVWEIDAAVAHPCLSDPLQQMAPLYYSRLAAAMLDTTRNAETPLVFTVTAMHGVGHRYMKEAFKACGFKDFVPVKEQMEPDPEFPTVRFPNPEEGKSALDLSFRTADGANSSVILANDPDADRLALAVKLEGGWKVFTGNEEGALLGWWAWQRHTIRSPEVPPQDVYMVASTVSSKILKAIACKEGFNFVETLTGFKWMCNKTCELLDAGKTVLFAFEEAIGFMNGVEVLDKDGVSAGVYMAELAAYLHTKGLTLHEQLNAIYETYGYHACRNSYYICKDVQKIKAIFERMRNFSGPKSYPKTISGGEFEVSGVRDLTTDYDSSQPDQRALLPSSASSQMITFSFTNGCVVTLRTSGTEPKIKYYSEICATPQQRNWGELEKELERLVSALVEELLQPQLNQLIPKAD